MDLKKEKDENIVSTYLSSFFRGIFSLCVGYIKTY